VAESQEKAKAVEREALEKELTEAGVDFTKPEEEAARLQREVEEARDATAKLLDEAEALLANDNTVSTTAATKPPVTQPIDSGSGDLDLD